MNITKQNKFLFFVIFLYLCSSIYSMSFVDIETDELNTCECGFKPTHYTIAYGKTPYDVYCEGCKKQTNRYRSIGGHHSNVINFWNEIAPLRELKEFTLEYNGKQYNINTIRNGILDTHHLDDKNVYILFENGKIAETNTLRFLIQGLDY